MTRFGKKSKKQKSLYLNGAIALAAAALILIGLILFWNRPQPLEVPVLETLPEPDANPYSAEDFTYQGDYLTCSAKGSRLGVDVSEHQGEIDWEQVKKAGMDFAIIRLGYRGYTEGGLFEDSLAVKNLKGAKKAGLSVGAYFYSQATTLEEAREEGKFAVKILDGMKLDYPLVFDWEYVSDEARTGKLEGRMVTDCTIAFCETVKSYGYEPMVYFNEYWGQRLFFLEELTEYPFWLAMYSEEMTYPYQIELWQYTPEGNVPGISGTVDLNIEMP